MTRLLHTPRARIVALALSSAVVLAGAWEAGAVPGVYLAHASDEPVVQQVDATYRPLPVLPAQELQVPATEAHPAYALYTPEGPAVPRAALLVLHGMGGTGPTIAGYFLAYAREHDLVVVAPTIPYGDWRDPTLLVREDARLLPQLAALLDAVPQETGVSLLDRAHVFGFSRGAQEALRFALFYPERVVCVAALSAGTYTLPAASVPTATGVLSAPMPYGIADVQAATGRTVDLAKLAGVHILVGVGAADNNQADVPRQWDPFVGNTRLERAQRFVAFLQQMGIQAEVAVVPGAAHEVSGAMLERVTGFLTREASGVPAAAA